jgi:HAE1 family hydrophobic/amphiphilic exporter-1
VGEVPVVVSLGDPVENADELEDLVLFATPAGDVTLGELATVEVAELPVALSRMDGERSATISVTPASDDLGLLTGALTDRIDALDLPTGVSVEMAGVAAEMDQAFAELVTSLGVAVLIVFILMVGTFGSLVQPFILLISIPFAATGAVLALVATDTPLGVAAFIGLLLLVGIVVANAIVLIDLTNQYRRAGLPLDRAIEEGARKRLRPILMTAAATVFALIPMAVGWTGGGGSFISQPLALVVIGGLVSSTLLTLVVVPVLYRFEARAHDRREARREAKLAARREDRLAARRAALGAEGHRQAGAANRSGPEPTPDGIVPGETQVAETSPDAVAPPEPEPSPATAAGAAAERVRADVAADAEAVAQEFTVPQDWRAWEPRTRTPLPWERRGAGRAAEAAETALAAPDPDRAEASQPWQDIYERLGLPRPEPWSLRARPLRAPNPRDSLPKP